MAIDHKDTEETFYNWDESDWPTPSQTQEIKDYIKLVRDIKNGKTNATDRELSRLQSATDDKP